jgi:hypothetical protein
VICMQLSMQLATDQDGYGHVPPNAGADWKEQAQ